MKVCSTELLPVARRNSSTLKPEIEFLLSANRVVKIKYLQDADTLYVEFRPTNVLETCDINGNTLMEFDQNVQFVLSPSNPAANRWMFQNFISNE